jgi:hypothetical protein
MASAAALSSLANARARPPNAPSNPSSPLTNRDSLPTSRDDDNAESIACQNARSRNRTADSSTADASEADEVLASPNRGNALNASENPNGAPITSPDELLHDDEYEDENPPGANRPPPSSSIVSDTRSSSSGALCVTQALSSVFPFPPPYAHRTFPDTSAS